MADNSIQQNSNRIKELKKEISRKASLANKRLKRLENNGLQNVPAYRNWVEYGGGVKFSVKGKNYNELQKELSRVNNFIASKTSTVRGVNKVLKQMASNAGISYKYVSELEEKTGAFFQLANKVDEYLNNANMAGQAIGYQKLWQVINEYIETEQIELKNNIDNIENLIPEISEMATRFYGEQTAINFYENIIDDFS